MDITGYGIDPNAMMLPGFPFGAEKMKKITHTRAVKAGAGP